MFGKQLQLNSDTIPMIEETQGEAQPSLNSV